MSEEFNTAQRLAQLVKDSEETISEAFTAYDAAQESDESDAIEKAYERLDGLDYGIAVERHVIITLAGGGPSLYLDATMDESGLVTEVVAVASWWSAPVRTPVAEDSGMWQLAERRAELAHESELMGRA